MCLEKMHQNMYVNPLKLVKVWYSITKENGGRENEY